jgi:uncharacterized flavoprotein (TIGR03862 family)
MAADILSAAGVSVDVYEAKPSVGRKFLMAGKGGMNITHSEPLEDFIGRYNKPNWLAPMIEGFDSHAIRAWMQNLGISSFIGTSGRVFPTDMKAAPLLRKWLSVLKMRGVRVHCAHYWNGFTDKGELRFTTKNGEKTVWGDATLLALGGASYPHLGSNGHWVPLLTHHGVKITPLLPSNCGFNVAWSSYMKDTFGQPLKNIAAWIKEARHTEGEILLSSYGIEGGLVYAQSKFLREELMTKGTATLYVDLLPHLSELNLASRLTLSAKQTLKNRWRKAGLNDAKGALIREYIPKDKWGDASCVAACVKKYPLKITGMQSLESAVSTAGGVQREALDNNLMFLALPNIFCAGEMLDWDAPTGGYLLTGCFATGAYAAKGILRVLNIDNCSNCTV